MEIKLTPQESEEYFFNALCNVELFHGEISCNIHEYKKAREYLISRNKNICYEDVYMQVLRDGNKLHYKDNEDESFNTDINLSMIHERVSKAPLNHLIDMINEEDDADTADAILQTVLFGEIIFA